MANTHEMPSDPSLGRCAEEAVRPARIWKFRELGIHRLVWERAEIDGSTKRVGFFNDLAECILDAKAHGFDDSKLERRKVPRDSKGRRATESDVTPIAP